MLWFAIEQDVDPFFQLSQVALILHDRLSLYYLLLLLLEYLDFINKYREVRHHIFSEKSVEALRVLLSLSNPLYYFHFKNIESLSQLVDSVLRLLAKSLEKEDLMGGVFNFGGQRSVYHWRRLHHGHGWGRLIYDSSNRRDALSWRRVSYRSHPRDRVHVMGRCTLVDHFRAWNWLPKNLSFKLSVHSM
jgi:hypothetical protein